MLIYENAVIGNFLFGAGASYGFRRQAQGMPVICINLLQQTPADQRLGDTLLHTSAFMRVLEFKRRESRSAKESEKLNILRRSLGGNIEMEGISRRIHWYVESFEGSKTRIVPYLDFDKSGVAATTLEPFIEQTITDAMSGSERAFMGKCQDYLAMLMLCSSPRLTGGGSGGGGVGAFIFALSNSGEVQFAALEQMIDLRLTRAEYERSSEGREIARARELDRLYEMQLQRSRSRGRGRSQEIEHER